MKKILVLATLLSISTTLSYAAHPENTQDNRKYITMKRAAIALGGAVVIGGVIWYFNQTSDDNMSNSMRRSDMCYPEDNICPDSLPTQLFAFVKQNGEIVMNEVQKCFWGNYYDYEKCFSLSGKKPTDLSFISNHFKNKILSLMQSSENDHIMSNIYNTNGDCALNSGMPCRASQWYLQLSEGFKNSTDTICSYYSYFVDTFTKAEYHFQRTPHTTLLGKLSLLLKPRAN